MLTVVCILLRVYSHASLNENNVTVMFSKNMFKNRGKEKFVLRLDGMIMNSTNLFLRPTLVFDLHKTKQIYLIHDNRITTLDLNQNLIDYLVWHRYSSRGGQLSLPVPTGTASRQPAAEVHAVRLPNHLLQGHQQQRRTYVLLTTRSW